ncbi:MAG: hypothetical protein WA030_04270 [Candidatus Microsaccharimonas sp.]
MRRPELIDTPYPYLSLQDIGVTSRELAPDLSDQQASSLEAKLLEIKEQYAPVDSTFYSIDAEALYHDLELNAASELVRTDRRVGVVYMDKDIAIHQALGERERRLDLSRSASGSIVSRRGIQLSADEQIRGMITWADQQQLDELVLVDDVLAFGDTVSAIVATIRAALDSDRPKIRMLAGIAASGGIWRGLEVAHEANIEVTALTTVLASDPVEGKTKGMAIPTSRDLTILGGKIGDLEGQSVPYFLPFSEPLMSILGERSQWKQASLDLLDFNETFISVLEDINGAPVTIGSLALSGFGIPYTSLDRPDIRFAVPDVSVEVATYIAKLRDVVHHLEV